jgi:hypothetical protein
VHNGKVELWPKDKPKLSSHHCLRWANLQQLLKRADEINEVFVMNTLHYELTTPRCGQFENIGDSLASRQ